MGGKNYKRKQQKKSFTPLSISPPKINNDIEEINPKTLNYNKAWINHLFQLNDGRLISCSSDGILNIYKKETFELELEIKEHLISIRSFTQLFDGRIITCSDDSTMKIIKLIENNKYEIDQILEGHKDSVHKIIEIKQHELISISSDGIMKIWILNNKNKFECILNIIFQNSNSICNILKLNEKEIVVSSYSDKCIKFYNIMNYSNITNINNIYFDIGYYRMNLIEDDLLCIGGTNSSGFYLIKISTHELIKKIPGPNSIISIFKCLDRLILCSSAEYNNHSLVKYKYENQNFIKVFEKVNAHNNYIWSCIELNNGVIVSGGADNYIKLWKSLV